VRAIAAPKGLRAGQAKGCVERLLDARTLDSDALREKRPRDRDVRNVDGDLEELRLEIQLPKPP
jgi:hypothetical protein